MKFRINGVSKFKWKELILRNIKKKQYFTTTKTHFISSCRARYDIKSMVLFLNLSEWLFYVLDEMSLEVLRFSFYQQTFYSNLTNRETKQINVI